MHLGADICEYRYSGLLFCGAIVLDSIFCSIFKSFDKYHTSRIYKGSKDIEVNLMCM